MIPTYGNRLRRAAVLALAVMAVAAGPAQAHVYLGQPHTPRAVQQHHLRSGHIVQRGATAPVAAPIVSQSSGVDWGKVAVGAGTVSFLLILAAAGGLSARRGRMVHR